MKRKEEEYKYCELDTKKRRKEPANERENREKMGP
jgi:hypothetical protein